MSASYWPLTEPDDPDRADLLRFVFLGTLGVELFTQVGHAARYGAGRFNVSHFPALDPWIGAPSYSVVLLVLLSMSFISLRTALVGGLRLALPLLCLGYGGVYFSSQMDSYQHHYLIWLLLLIGSVGIWLEPGAPQRLPGWVMGMIRAQIAIMYAWAAFAKMHPEWLGGGVLFNQIQATSRGGPWLETLAELVNITPAALAQGAAWSVCVAELMLVVGWLWRRSWPLALPMGLAFHAGVELLGFEIGLFSWFMFGLYALLLPQRVVTALARALPSADQGPWTLSWTLLGALACGGLALALPIDEAWTLACVWFGLSILLSEAGGWRSGLAAALSAAALLTLSYQTEVVRDFYKYMGGDTRRRGDLDEAIHAYGKVVELDPGYYSGWVRLADLQMAAGRPELAPALLETARALEPENPEALRRLATLYAQAGDRERALTAAKLVLKADPEDAGAKAVLQRFGE